MLISEHHDEKINDFCPEKYIIRKNIRKQKDNR